MGHLEVLQFLVETVGIPFSQNGEEDDFADSCVHAACGRGRDAVLNYLIQNGCRIQGGEWEDEGTPLSLAVRSGSFQCVRTLISAGVEPRDTESNPVYEAAACGYVDIMRLCLDRWPGLLDVPGMAVTGGDGLWTDEEEYTFGPTVTPLVVAVLNGRADCVHLLQLRGAAGHWSPAAVRAILAEGEAGVDQLDTLTGVIGLPSCGEVREALTDWPACEWPESPVPIVKLVVDATLAPDADRQEIAGLWSNAWRVFPLRYEEDRGMPYEFEYEAGMKLWRVKERLVLEVASLPTLRGLLLAIGASLEWLLPSWLDLDLDYDDTGTFSVDPLERLLDAYETVFGADWVGRLHREVDLFACIRWGDVPQITRDIRALSRAHVPIRFILDPPLRHYPAIDKAVWGVSGGTKNINLVLDAFEEVGFELSMHRYCPKVGLDDAVMLRFGAWRGLVCDRELGFWEHPSVRC
jgi:hypothetical protein